MAYEVESIDGLMRGAGRLKHNGFNVEWGVGRHGPGDNVFSYFVEPNGFVVEYTAEVEQVDEATYMAHDATYWREFPGRPCRWGMAGHPSNRLKAAFAGDISVADEDDGRRCEDHGEEARTVVATKSKPPPVSGGGFVLNLAPCAQAAAAYQIAELLPDSLSACRCAGQLEQARRGAAEVLCPRNGDERRRRSSTAGRNPSAEVGGRAVACPH
jgi:hypothetical protein